MTREKDLACSLDSIMDSLVQKDQTFDLITNFVGSWDLTFYFKLSSTL